MSKIKLFLHHVLSQNFAIVPWLSIDCVQAQAAKILSQRFGLDDVFALWTIPADPSHGDFATAIALQVAKRLKKNPAEIATVLAEGLSLVSGVERADVAGAGYVNVVLTSKALLEGLKNTRGAILPAKTRTDEAPVIVEYSQPNIAKPLGIHHIMSTVIGQAIANLYRHLGYNIIRVNHIGDWGTQFGKLAVAMEKWGTKSASECSLDELLALYVKFHEEAEKDSSLDDAAREAFLKIEQDDPKLRQFWRDVVAVTMKAMNTLYERLDVHIEHAHGEAMYEEMMAPILQEGMEKGVFKKGDKGAIVVEFPPEKQLPTAVVQKGDSATIYMTRDFAQIRYRIDRWHPKDIFYVVDTAQALHFQQLFAAVEMLGWDLPHLEHLVIGRMRFQDKAMSTRKGNILKLEHVLDEAVARATDVIQGRGDTIQTDNAKDLAEMIGVGSVVYGVLSQNRKMGMIFDWDKFLSFEGNSAPYLQYTHARACSVLRKVPKIDAAFPEVSSLSPSERSLVHVLLQYPDVLKAACEDHLPHTLAHYLYELAQAFNAFYNSEQILQSEEPKRSLRVALTALTRDVLASSAGILTLRLPERM